MSRSVDVCCGNETTDVRSGSIGGCCIGTKSDSLGACCIGTTT
ncbi:unnamed protein product, partial [Rotaria sordida]